MFTSSPHLAVYRDRLLLIALCQGGALHYIDRTNGVKDLDVYSFYARHPTVRMHPLRHTVADFGKSEFGHRPADVVDRRRQFDVGLSPYPVVNFGSRNGGRHAEAV